MADKLNLDTSNPKRDLMLPTRDKSKTLYAGEEAVKIGTTSYLFKFEEEPQGTYDFRLNRATYDNYIDMVIDVRQSLMYKTPPEREKLLGKLPDINTNNIDRKGTDVETYFKTVTEAAQVEGLVWVWVNKPELERDEQGNTKTPSKLDEKENNLLPYFTTLNMDAVIDWEEDDDGLVWALIALVDKKKRETAGEPVMMKQQRLVLGRDTWTLYEEKGEYYDPQKKTAKSTSTQEREWIVKEEGENPLGVVPLVAFYGIKNGENYGAPVTKDIIGYSISLYNKKSDRDYAEYMTNNPILWTATHESIDTITAVGHNGVALGENGKMGYAEITGAGVEASRKSESELISRIYELALKQIKKDTAQIQSAESQKTERRAFTSGIAKNADSYEKSEIRCWELWAKWQLKTVDITDEDVVYVKDYDDKMIDAQMLNSFSEQVVRGQLSKETFNEIRKLGEAMPIEVDWEEEKQRIYTEAREDFQNLAPLDIGENDDSNSSVDNQGNNEP